MKPKILFSKYQAAGNDFILIDNRNGALRLARAEIARLCHRKYGIGADGLILLEDSNGFDFAMKNFNSDGGECSMCGNGGRALIQFVQDLGPGQEHYRFLAIDGPHEANNSTQGIELKMTDVFRITETPVGPTLDTGSPHLVISVGNLLQYEVVKEGRALRNSPLFMPAGINVNFFEIQSDRIFLRTYERGVEDETLSCGTGAIATAMVVARDSGSMKPDEELQTVVHCQGGELRIRFTPSIDSSFKNIWLSGPVEKTFEGEI
ncbi:MAG: diaminopimelate epimerase [Bdellovibrionales bacterium]|nr:diaminopimelate epimerase [Bdellovibrionales bacterium]